jgi:hypothetical protein
MYPATSWRYVSCSLSWALDWSAKARKKQLPGKRGQGGERYTKGKARECKGQLGKEGVGVADREECCARRIVLSGKDNCLAGAGGVGRAR